MSKPTIDVIIPFYDAYTTIDRALASVLMQKVTANIKVTLVDDCSKAGCKDIVEAWKKFLNIQCVERKTNGGPGLARQSGIDKTNGEYIAFLDADDSFIGSYALSLLLNGIENGEQDMCIGTFIEESENGQFIPHGVNQVWLHGKLIRRSAIKEIKLRFNSTRQCEDMSWNSVFFQTHTKIVYIEKDVYLWENTNKHSLTRDDAIAYKYGYGWRGMVENMAWAAEELIKRKSPKAKEYVSVCLCGMHIRFNESYIYMPEEREENMKKAKEFYRRACEPIKKDLDYTYLTQIYKGVERQYNNSVVQVLAYPEFLKMLGY